MHGSFDVDVEVDLPCEPETLEGGVKNQPRRVTLSDVLNSTSVRAIFSEEPECVLSFVRAGREWSSINILAWSGLRPERKRGYG
jgi:hypothetical protein